MMHPLSSDDVRDQLVHRTVDCNGKVYRPDGEYVLYWMQSTHRLDENWALRAAIRTANRLRLPLLIHQGLDPTSPHASDRHHTFLLQGARDVAREASARGLPYQFVLRARRDEDRRVVDRLAARAYVVFTDFFPTAGVHARTMRFAERASCRVLAVDSVCTVPSGLFAKAEWAARTIRPKLARVLHSSIEPVQDALPHVVMSDSLQRSVAEMVGEAGLEALSLASMSDEDIARCVARCEIDHAVPAVPLAGGRAAGVQRLADFVSHGLATYDERRNDAADADGTSRLSPYLHFGHVSGAEVVRAALASGAPAASVSAFVDQVTTWRELAFNWCVRTPQHEALASLPDWIQRSMRAHMHDARPGRYDLSTLEEARTGDALWNAAQMELVTQGVMHNYARMLWGKTVLLWTRDYEEARAWLFHLNDKYALDGRDPNSVGGILWCFGLFDRSWGNRPVWGGIRPMVTSRARLKFNVERYISRVSQAGLAARSGTSST